VSALFEGAHAGAPLQRIRYLDVIMSL
jgi:hypothetical protein